jgi:hypothetical protein
MIDFGTEVQATNSVSLFLLFHQSIMIQRTVPISKEATAVVPRVVLWWWWWGVFSTHRRAGGGAGTEAQGASEIKKILSDGCLRDCIQWYGTYR